MLTEESKNRFKRIFAPERVAIVGVAAEGFGFGRGILLSLLSIGFSGELFPVNRRGGEICGLKIHKSIDDIPGDIDFAIIAVPADSVPEALESCMKKGAAGAEILSSGFGETGTSEGMELDKRIRDIAGRGIRVLGPNCFGIYSPRSGLTLLPGPDLSRRPGGVSFISQSGGHSIDFSHVGKWKGIGFSKVVSFGNGADLRETELLEYFTEDPETEVIGMYIEGVDDGREFLRVLRNAASVKPVIVLKGGLSEAGGRAAASHTASMGGARAIWEAALNQCNAVRAMDMRELSDAALAFSMLPRKSFNGISIIGGGGALGVAAADFAEEFGFSIPGLGADIQARILKHLPGPGSSPANPVDIANPYVPPDALREILVCAGGDDRIDLQVVVQLLYHYRALSVMLGSGSVREITPTRGLAEACADAMKATGKPVLLVLPNYKREPEAMEIEEVIRDTRRLFLEKGIPVFDDLRDAMKAAGAVSRYYCRRK
ncbi:MAG: CoA-binding protein [Spirochaetes bacterium]|jgi:acyl-CoA synthetase (NDP forming)|nr:CoA-binding protein [Spirochaetota bacterium]